jgi:hypothetical protein
MYYYTPTAKLRRRRVQYGQGHTMINHPDGHKINPSVGISPTFSHCDSEKD